MKWRPWTYWRYSVSENPKSDSLIWLSKFKNLQKIKSQVPHFWFKLMIRDLISMLISNFKFYTYKMNLNWQPNVKPLLYMWYLFFCCVYQWWHHKFSSFVDPILPLSHPAHYTLFSVRFVSPKVVLSLSAGNLCWKLRRICAKFQELSLFNYKKSILPSDQTLAEGQNSSQVKYLKEFDWKSCHKLENVWKSSENYCMIALQ